VTDFDRDTAVAIGEGANRCAAANAAENDETRIARGWYRACFCSRRGGFDAMTRLNRCGACAGFMIPAASECPHCGARARRRLRRTIATMLALAGTGSLSVTLMACYGGPCASDSQLCGYPYNNDMSSQVVDMEHGSDDGGATEDLKR
jgi:hypothetical protein